MYIRMYGARTYKHTHCERGTKRELPLIATSTQRIEMKLGFTGRVDVEGERKGSGGRACTVENTYLLPRSRRINLFVGGAVRFLGRYYTRGRE